MDEERVTADQLAATWDSIRGQFFRGWNSDSWSCELSDLAQGKRLVCRVPEKQVYILPSLSPKELDRVIVHALCHARRGSGHEPFWSRRMAVIEQDALRRGLDDLAKGIREEIDGCEGTPDETEGLIFDWPLFPPRRPT